jgi:hypothetical protein
MSGQEDNLSQIGFFLKRTERLRQTILKNAFSGKPKKGCVLHLIKKAFSGKI